MELKIKGVYKHFKGKYYIVEDVALHSETNEKYVVYRQLYGNNELFVYTRLTDLLEGPTFVIV